MKLSLALLLLSLLGFATLQGAFANRALLDDDSDDNYDNDDDDDDNDDQRVSSRIIYPLLGFSSMGACVPGHQSWNGP